MTSTRSAASVRARSWVATIAVIPSACTMLRSSVMIWPAERESSCPVGSSASSTVALLASALAALQPSEILVPDRLFADPAVSAAV